jgi:DNA-directed RNA polymerase specialized sigma24 family protein
MRAKTLAVDNPFLIARARKGDLEALEALYRAYEKPVYRLARRLCRRPEDAEEVVQETFLEVIRNVGKYRGDGPMLQWIRRIAANKAISRLRGLSLRKEELLSEDVWPGDLVGDGIGPSLPVPGSVVHQVDVETALSRLSDTSRAVVWLHDVEGYTHEEIAEMMGKTPSFSKSQLARAHERLRAHLTGAGEEQPCT